MVVMFSVVVWGTESRSSQSRSKFMMFSRRQYRVVAEVLAEQLHESRDIHAAHRVVDRFAERFRMDNPQFQPDRFREAVVGTFLAASQSRSSLV